MFDWQTSDEREWVDLPPTQEPGPPRLGWRSVAVLAVLLLLGSAAFLLIRQTTEEIDKATAAAQADILSSHTLLQRTAENQDKELFTALLSGRDKAWVGQQLDAFERGDFGERRFFDQLVTLPQREATPGEMTVVVADDFRSAELRYPVKAVVTIGEGITKTVTLSHTALYRRGAERWLYAPLDQTFWGSRAFLNLSRLTLIYPERDAEIAAELGEHLNAELERLCSAAYFACDDGWRMRVRFETRAQVWDRMTAYAYHFAPNDQLELPTPTLIGLPTDAESKATLQQQYTIAVMGNAIARLAEYNCCAHRNMFKLLVDVLLDEMGIRPLPREAVDYDALFAAWNSNSMSRLWGRFVLEPHDRSWGVSLVRYLQSLDPNLSTVEMLRSLGDVQGGYEDWLAGFVASYDADQFRAAWEQFVFSETSAGQIEEPIHPLPMDRIRIVCSDDEPAIYEYDLAKDSWRAIWRFPVENADYVAQPQSLGASGMYAINRYGFVGERRQELWLLRKDGREQFLLGYDSSDGFAAVFDVHPNGRWVGVYQIIFSSSESTHIIFDIDDCTESGCSVVNAVESIWGGAAEWSNDGRYLLYVDATKTDPNELTLAGFDRRIAIGNAQGLSLEVVESDATWPIWLNAQSIAYLKAAEQAADPKIELIRYDLEEGVSQSLLSSTDLLDALPPGETDTIYPSHVLPASSDGNHLLVFATAQFNTTNDDGNYTFHVRLDTETPTIALLENQLFSTYLEVQGQWYTYFDLSPGGLVSIIRLENEASGQHYTLEGNGLNGHQVWAPSGHWVLYGSRQGQLVLLEPESGYRRFINHNFGFCNALHWVES